MLLILISIGFFRNFVPAGPLVRCVLLGITRTEVGSALLSLHNDFTVTSSVGISDFSQTSDPNLWHVNLLRPLRTFPTLITSFLCIWRRAPDNRRGHIAVDFGEKTPLLSEIDEQLGGDGQSHVWAVAVAGRPNGRPMFESWSESGLLGACTCTTERALEV